MERFLIKLEVSRKQDYIFGSKRLKDNASRSAQIDFVTGRHLNPVTELDFFGDVAGDLYDRNENLVYAGGGHAVLQFDSEKQADDFAKRVTRSAMERFPGMELFVKRMRYDEEILSAEERYGPVQRKTAAENLRKLSRELEAKKDLRQYAVRQESFGVEELDKTTFQPLRKKPDKTKFQPVRLDEPTVESMEDVVKPPAGFDFPREMEVLCGADNFAAVIHIDGNGMGTRVNEIYDKQEETDWEGLREELYTFSNTVDRAFKAAFCRTAAYVAAHLDIAAAPPKGQSAALPIRPVILAGDDVCFVTRGKIGLECARLFLEYLATPEDSTLWPYYACAGVVLAHRKYPFHKAYELSERLCSNAKKFVADICRVEKAAPAGTCRHDISVMDWHIEFGQLRGGLDEIRKAYETEDTRTKKKTSQEQEEASREHRRMELRPVVLLAGKKQENGSSSGGKDEGEDFEKRFREAYEEKTGGVRTYRFFKALCLAMLGEYGQTARGKIKDLRNAFKQGEVESRYFLESREVLHLLDRAFPAQYPTEREQIFRILGIPETKPEGGQEQKIQLSNALIPNSGQIRSETLFSGQAATRTGAFRDVDGVSRCLFFDAIEMIDHFIPLDGGDGEEKTP